MKKLKMNLQMFSSTNKTTHYELSQYVSSDKPTYLTDYNGDMSKIDTGIYNAKNEADTNATNIGDLTSLTTDTKSTLVGAINEVDSHADTNAGNISQNTTDIATNTSHIGTMTNLTTTEKTNLVGAVNEINALLSKFNLSTFKTYSSTSDTDIEVHNGTLNTVDLTVATNSDGSIFKFYGNFRMTKDANINELYIILKNTGIVPSSAFTVKGNVQVDLASNPENVDGVFPCNFEVQANGNIKVGFGDVYSNIVRRGFLAPCLYFATDFGDTPSN